MRSKLYELLYECRELIIPARFSKGEDQVVDSLLVVWIEGQCVAAMLDCSIQLSPFDVHRTEQVLCSNEARIELYSPRGRVQFFLIILTSVRLGLSQQRLREKILCVCFVGMGLYSSPKFGQRFCRLLLLRLDNAFGDSKKRELWIQLIRFVEVL